jgi:Gas vesicle protein
MGAVQAAPPARLSTERIALVDLRDRILAGGVVITGEITLSMADVDLVTVSLRALLASVGALEAAAEGTEEGPR